MLRIVLFIVICGCVITYSRDCKMCVGVVGALFDSTSSRFSKCAVIRGPESTIREIRLFNCNVRIIPNGWSLDVPINIRDGNGNICEAPKLQTTRPEPAHMTARSTNHSITSTVQPEPAHVTAWSTNHSITSTVQPEPAHVTARSTNQTITSTVQPETTHVTAKSTNHSITSRVQPETTHVTARSTNHLITSTVQPETTHVTAKSTNHLITSTVQRAPAHATAGSTLFKILKTVKTSTKAWNVPDTDADLFDEPGTGQHVTLLLSINIVLCIFILICVFISINDKLKKIRCRAQRNDKPASKKSIRKRTLFRRLTLFKSKPGKLPSRSEIELNRMQALSSDDDDYDSIFDASDI